MDEQAAKAAIGGIRGPARPQPHPDSGSPAKDPGREDDTPLYPFTFDGHLQAQLGRALWPRGGPLDRKFREAAIRDVMHEASPRSPIERMLVAHVLACHCAAMECFEQASLAKGSSRRSYWGVAGKLSRTVAQLI